jgi:hypothetical protein
MRHRAGDFTGPAADALFSIALHERAELFRSQFHTPMTRIARPLCFRYGDISAEVTATLFLRNSSDAVLLARQTMSIDIKSFAAAHLLDSIDLSKLPFAADLPSTSGGILS